MSGESAAMPKPITGRHVLIGMVAFFGVVIGVNLVFAYFAVDSWTGLTAKDTYRKGLNYNETLDDAQRQAELGWTSAVAYSGGSLRVTLREADGAPISDARVEALVRRPTHEGMDRTVTLMADPGGDFFIPFEFPAPGQWDVDLTVTRGDLRYRMIHRIQVAP
jgi:nitrogen fixation protein FixH